jgi:hypothetical protein
LDSLKKDVFVLQKSSAEQDEFIGTFCVGTGFSDMLLYSFRLQGQINQFFFKVALPYDCFSAFTAVLTITD